MVPALVAEAAWIAVIAGLLNAFMLVPPAVGIPGLFLAALAGLVADRAVGPRLGARWPALAGMLAVACGLAGWLSSPGVRLILAADGMRGLGAALAANPGGWLAWVAFVRGMPYARLPPDPDRVGRLVTVAVPGLALASLVGGRFPEPWSSAYLAAAEAQVLVFLLAAIPALALSRMGQVDRGAPMGWWRNPSWLSLAALLLLGTALIALLVSATAGPAIAMAASAAVVPVLLVALVAGIDRRLLRVLLVCAAVAGVVALALRLIGDVSRPAPPAPAAGGSQARDAASAVPVTLGVLLLAVAVATVVALLLLRLLVRREERALVTMDEEREIDHGGALEAPSRVRGRRRFRRRSSPADAAEAYRALVADLDGRPPAARLPAETPSEHARRLRDAGLGGLPLDLLAADYGLVQFGDQRLTAREDRRAVARWATLRRTLLSPVPASRRGSRATGADHARITGMPKPDIFPATSRIVVYGADWCGDCVRTRRWLDASGTPYDWVDRDADPAVRARLADAGYLAIPIVVIPGGRVLVEPSDAELATAVASAVG